MVSGLSAAITDRTWRPIPQFLIVAIPQF